MAAASLITATAPSPPQPGSARLGPAASGPKQTARPGHLEMKQLQRDLHAAASDIKTNVGRKQDDGGRRCDTVTTATKWLRVES